MASQGAKKGFLQVFKNDSQQPYKLLIVGETGSGKTSFLNLLYNCNRVQQLGCKFDEEGLKHFQQFNDGSLENDGSRYSESKTSATRLYNIEIGTMKVGIIDTPGLGDSRGLETDKKHVKTIMDVLHKEDYINCVCLIINGRTARVTVTLRYVLTEITAIMPKQVLDNLVVVFSNCTNADLCFSPDDLTKYLGREPQHTFCIDNPYSMYQKVKEQQKDLRRIAEDLEQAFERAASVLQELCEVMYNFTPVHTKDFTDLFENKQAIESDMQLLLTKQDNHERRHLSEEVLSHINKFETLGMARNYTKVIENQLAVIETRLRNATGPELAANLRMTKMEFEKKLMLIHAASRGK